MARYARLLDLQNRFPVALTPYRSNETKTPFFLAQDMSVRTRMLSRMAQQLNEVAQKSSLAVRSGDEDLSAEPLKLGAGFALSVFCFFSKPRHHQMYPGTCLLLYHTYV